MKRLLAVSAFVGAMAPALQAQEISPGLWELAAEVKMQGATIPPSRFSQCFTAQDIAAGVQYGLIEKGKCAASNLKNIDGKISYELSCAANGARLAGTGTGTMSATAFAFEQKLHMTPDQGMGEMHLIVTGRRLGDCK